MSAHLTLNDGTSIPQIGFGTWLLEPKDVASSLDAAFGAGYRHIDTAQGYGNEAAIGSAIEASNVSRDELYITTKLDNSNHAPAAVRSSLEKSLADLRTDAVDLFLIHWPLPTVTGSAIVDTWGALVEAQRAGLTRSIGVSNFEPAHLEAIIAATGVVPAVNQIELHPHFANTATREASLAAGSAIEAWSPLGHGGVLTDPVVADIAAAAGRTAAQVVLRWHLQRDHIVFPKSQNPARIAENFGVFDFELSAEDVERISALDRGEDGRVGPNPATFEG